MSIRTRRGSFLVVAYALWSATACASNEGKAGAAVQDSAGVRLVTFPATPFADTVPLAPVLSIGREGDPKYEFFGVRAVAPLASGNVVVGNGGTAELRYYGADGHFIRQVGGKGDGPFEFRFLGGVYEGSGDTLIANDPQRRRLLYFDSAGAFVRGDSYAAEIAEEMPKGTTGACAFPGLLGVLADGTRLVMGWGCVHLTGSAGRTRMTVPLALVGREGRDTLGTFTALDIWELAPSEGRRINQELIPFSGRLAYSAGADAVFTAEGSDYTVHRYGGDGRLAAILREDDVPPPVTPADRDAFLKERLEEKRPFPDGVPFPDRFAGYDQLLVSHEGELWAKHAGSPSEETTRWSVFSADGRAVRHLVLPAVEVRAVRAGRIYGYRTDDMGVQTVVVLKVPPTQPSGAGGS